MIYITSSAYTDEHGVFKISTVYCISDNDAFMSTRELNWKPEKLPVTKDSMKRVVGTQHFSVEPLVYSPMRTLEGDESAASFLGHISKRLRENDTEDFNKKLFRILCELGSGE